MRKIGASGMPPNDESNRVLGTIKQTLFVLQAAVAAVLRANLPEDALYLLPGNSSNQKAMADEYAAGPVAVIAYLRRMGQLRGYLSRFLFVCPIGLALGRFTNLNNWNWMSQSLHCTVVDVIDP